jgi:hypothetical protein
MRDAVKIMPDFTGRDFRFGYMTALNTLANLGVDLNRVNIKAVGTIENYRGEIHFQDPEPGEELTGSTLITLEVGEASAVDYLPYQFFYGLHGERETDRSWEDRARSLMAPFDSTVIRHRASVRFNTLQYEFGIIEEKHLERFLSLFDFDTEGMTSGSDDVLLFVSLLPSLYLWGGNAEIITGVLRRVFGHKFILRENVESETEIPDSLRYRLGGKVARLGRETVLGGSFRECDSTYELIIGGVAVDEAKDFMPGGRVRKRIERILDYCMPGDLDCRITVKVDGEKPGLGDRTYLGYSTFV